MSNEPEMSASAVGEPIADVAALEDVTSEPAGDDATLCGEAQAESIVTAITRASDSDRARRRVIDTSQRQRCKPP